LPSFELTRVWLDITDVLGLQPDLPSINYKEHYIYKALES